MVKTRVQRDALAGTQPRDSTWQVFRKLSRGGIAKLYRGLGVSAFRSFFTHGLMWFILENGESSPTDHRMVVADHVSNHDRMKCPRGLEHTQATWSSHHRDRTAFYRRDLLLSPGLFLHFRRLYSCNYRAPNVTRRLCSFHGVCVAAKHAGMHPFAPDDSPICEERNQQQFPPCAHSGARLQAADRETNEVTPCLDGR
jgi:hypothetical protein